MSKLFYSTTSKNFLGFLTKRLQMQETDSVKKLHDVLDVATVGKVIPLKIVFKRGFLLFLVHLLLPLLRGPTSTSVELSPKRSPLG